jgi:Na+/H+ antiporter NhaD/arsenite permease-like protein
VVKKGAISLLICVIFMAFLFPAVYTAHGNAIAAERTQVNRQAPGQEGRPHKVDANNQTMEAEGHHYHVDGKELSLLWAIPFVGLLLSIAIFPLAAPHFWHNHYGKVSLAWGLAFLVAFTIQFGFGTSVFYVLEVYLREFIPFIILLLALFTVSGGIQLKGELIGSPAVNGGFLLLGTLLASWMGTTGAAMLLIRPLIRANAWRAHKTHVIVFFIFLVANIGGSLTPLGDPPLFLGFLKGVSFFWTMTHVYKETLVASGVLLILFLLFDWYYYSKEKDIPRKSEAGESLSIRGTSNFLLLAAVVGAVLFSSIDMGTAFLLHGVSMPMSTLVQIGLLVLITIISMLVTDKEIRKGNEFSWEPIREVAKLFAAIFITMVAPIAMLKAGSEGPMGLIIRGVVDASGEFRNPQFFWATGMLSSFLDNAPTYLVFFETAGGHALDLMTKHANTLVAISAGAVFMGANTYIGNAPNFMVKSIAEESGIKMPSFFGYMFKYSIPILIPVFIIITILLIK